MWKFKRSNRETSQLPNELHYRASHGHWVMLAAMLASIAIFVWTASTDQGFSFALFIRPTALWLYVFLILAIIGILVSPYEPEYAVSLTAEGITLRSYWRKEVCFRWGEIVKLKAYDGEGGKIIIIKLKERKPLFQPRIGLSRLKVNSNRAQHDILMFAEARLAPS